MNLLSSASAGKSQLRGGAYSVLNNINIRFIIRVIILALICVDVPPPNVDDGTQKTFRIYNVGASTEGVQSGLEGTDLRGWKTVV